MTESNRMISTVHRVLVAGDNRLATSIISGLSSNNLEIHQSTHSQTTLETTPKVTIHKIDTEPGSLTSLLDSLKPELIFSTTLPGSFSYQKELIDSAISVGISRFVACEWSQDTLNEYIQKRLPPSQERAKTIEYLREQTEKSDDFSWVAVATGCSLEHALLSGNLGFDIEWRSATVHGTGDEEFAACSSEWSGKVAKAIIEHWEEWKNQFLYVPGLITTARAILEVLGRQTGKDWMVGNVDIEDMLREAERRFERGFPDAGMFLMERGVLFDTTLDAVRPFIEDDARGKLGLEVESLEMIVKRVLHDFKHRGKGGCGCD